MAINSSQRLIKHDQLKDIKNKSFASKFNQQSNQINR
jgi:hypothetical protein